MASGLRNQERVPENLKKQLAFAVRTIQWSYGIFWSISERQPGVLEWGDGYYNGDIKTRKTVQSTEFNSDRMAFQRSDQLKELYESLSAGEANPQARRPSAALSPEDLTDLEWYYLVCMSFVFNLGQGLPGRTLATGESIWLRNAHYADSRVFSRSLLAKSASIQTVVCFPYLRGVVELGVSETVMEDPSLIRLAKNSLSDSKALARDVVDGKLVTVMGCEEVDMVSLDNSSSDFEENQIPEDSFVVGGLQFVDDELTVNSSDCISQTLAGPKSVASVDELSGDLHYHSMLSSLLKSSHPLILGSRFQKCNKGSSFIGWRNVGGRKAAGWASQRVLKTVLMEVPRMHGGGRLVGSPGENEGKDGLGIWKPDSSSEKTENLDERFSILKTLVPSINKFDKVSILDTTIEYLKMLEKRVGELESSGEATYSQGRAKRKPGDTVERTSDNYGQCKRTMAMARKRKNIGDVDNVDPELAVSVVDAKDVMIELRCPWREGLLLEVMEVMSGLCLDSHSVQSSTSNGINGIVSLSIKSKTKEAATTSAAMIRRALDRFTAK